jgi:hypothetical protein
MKYSPTVTGSLRKVRSDISHIPTSPHLLYIWTSTSANNSISGSSHLDNNFEEKSSTQQYSFEAYCAGEVHWLRIRIVFAPHSPATSQFVSEDIRMNQHPEWSFLCEVYLMKRTFLSLVYVQAYIF